MGEARKGFGNPVLMGQSAKVGVRLWWRFKLLNKKLGYILKDKCAITGSRPPEKSWILLLMFSLIICVPPPHLTFPSRNSEDLAITESLIKLFQELWVQMGKGNSYIKIGIWGASKCVKRGIYTFPPAAPSSLP